MWHCQFRLVKHPQGHDQYVQMQKGFSDCGVFAIAFARSDEDPFDALSSGANYQHVPDQEDQTHCTEGAIFAMTAQSILIIIIIYSCCCRSAYAIDHAPTDAGGACKTSSQRTRARTTRDHTILITIQFLLPSLPYQ